MSTKDRCTICNALLNEDGTTDMCAGECDRQQLPEHSPTEELNFHEGYPSRSFRDEQPEAPTEDEEIDDLLDEYGFDDAQ